MKTIITIFVSCPVLMPFSIKISVLLLVAHPAILGAEEGGNVDLEAIKHPVKPMLWKIEGKGLKKPSYLFGTIHLADPRVTRLHPSAQQAFDQAGSVFTEVDLSPVAQLAVAPMLMRNDDQSLEQLLGQETMKAFEDELKAINPALNSKPFQKMKLWALAFVLPQVKMQLQGKVPLDMLLWQSAKKAGKETGALETAQQQLGQLDKLTVDEQKQFFVTTLKVFKKAREQKIDPYKAIIDAYLLGDKGAVEKELTRNSFMGLEIDQNVLEKFIRLLLHERNVVMAASIQKALLDPDKGSHFFAAGTAHYVGEKSVNDLLEKAGYTITPVTD